MANTTSSTIDSVQSLVRQVSRGKLTRREALIRGAALGLTGPAMLALSQATTVRSAVARSQDSGTPVAGGTLRVGLQADPAQLDPALTSLTAAWHIIEHVYECLVTYDETLNPIPALAETWDISADGLTYTFHLRQGVLFHNGREFVADDVKYSAERIIDPALGSPHAEAYSAVATIEVVDPYTVVFTLNGADSSFLSKLMGNAGYVVPKEVVEEHGDLNTVMVGTGPFTFVDYIPNTEVNLAKNADYWEEGKPYLDAIQLLVASENTSRTAALTSGTVDFIEYAPYIDMPIFESDESIVVTGDANTNIRYMGINVTRDPLSDVRIRQAISKVIDRGPVIDAAMFGAAAPTSAIFPATFWAGGEFAIDPVDVDGAKALMDEAGFADGFECVITSWAQYSFLSNAAIVVQEQIRQIGIEAEVNLQENAVYLADYFAGNFDMSVTGTSAYIDPNDVIQGNFGTGESNNGTKYSNPAVDELIAAGVAATDQAERAGIYNEIQTILLQDLPWINLYIATQYEAMKSNVKGYVHIPTGTNRSFRDVWLEQ